MSKREKSSGINVGGGATIGLGSILAIVISWTTHHAIGWALIHGILGWIYVIYYLFTDSSWTWF